MAEQDLNPDGLDLSGDKQEDSADLCVNQGGLAGRDDGTGGARRRGGKGLQDVEKRKPGMGVAVYHCFQGASLQHE